MKTIIITENPAFWEQTLASIPNLSFETPDSYLSQQVNHLSTKSKIINLSGVYNYQSIGYYVSLLGQARGDKVIPSVLTIQDFNTKASKHLITQKYYKDIQKTLKPITSDKFELSIYFGRNIAKHYDQLCKKFYNTIPMPLFRIYFTKNKKLNWHISKINTLNIDEIPKHHHAFLSETATNNFQSLKTLPYKKKKFACSIAMLVNPDEKLRGYLGRVMDLTHRV